MSRKRYSISYLAGHGIGAEITAQASRVTAAAAAMHGFALDEEHVAFGADAFVRYGNPFPPASRRAVASSDAVLVPADDGGALDALEADLDLQASVVRVRVDARRAAGRGALGVDRRAGFRAGESQPRAPHDGACG
jgi:isocitrate/isopropylmalate dehydrogenase